MEKHDERTDIRMNHSDERHIHHYTNIDSLAYILSSRKLRFTRLDQFDDVQEGVKIANWDFGAMLFASCWVTEQEEDYPQWAMYGDAMRGVRITLPVDPFDWYTFEAGDGEYVSDMLTPLPPALARTDHYKVVPDLHRKGAFLREVRYVGDVDSVWRDACEVGEGSLGVTGSLQDLAAYKSKRWEFQREHRFVLHLIGRMRSEGGAIRGPIFTSIDVPMSTAAIDRMKIRMGPLSSQADRIIVEALAARFSPSIQVESSHLAGMIRQRSS